MPQLVLKPSHKIIANFYKAVADSAQMSQRHEGAVAPHFAALLRACAAPHGWTLQEQYHIPRKGQHPLRVDGALLDLYQLRHGVWEAKDSDDDLAREARAKIKQGYPTDNILFQSPARAILYQDGRLVLDADITNPEQLVEALKQFFAHEPPAFEQWERAVAEFKEKVPELAQSMVTLIEKERRENKRFVAAFDEFTDLVRQSINPNVSVAAVEEMLIQHLLTERIFRKVFNNPDFAQRNVIAREIEKVISALTIRSFSRSDFLGSLDRFYGAIETTAATIADYREKQSFLNTVYEQFFQGFSVKVADTHGIVYTPQAIVDFMVRSVDGILRREFGKAGGLAADGVAILDPFVGTGNFILRVMRQMPRSKLPRKYRDELFCNEVMLLPYYIAGMNIEHEYVELIGQYEPFEGVALVDTFELAESRQLPLFVKENTQRVQRQKDAPIFVIIGNPPYNAGQVNENDNNRNRRYPVIDERVSKTYGAASSATLVRKLNDPYVKAFRWATDRIRDDGVIAFVTNSSFLTELTFDGMRAFLENEFSMIYVLDLGGNVRKNPRLSGSTHNVFGIQVGVCITFLVRKGPEAKGHKAQILYASCDPDWRRQDKYDFLDQHQDVSAIEWQPLSPDSKNTWLTSGLRSDFQAFMPLGSKLAKRFGSGDTQTIFRLFSLGVGTNRDDWAYSFNEEDLEEKNRKLLENYNSEVMRLRKVTSRDNLDELVNANDSYVKWTDRLKEALKQGKVLEYNASMVRPCLYRPFTQKYLYFDPLLVQRRYRQASIFPTIDSDNVAICVSQTSERPFSCIASDVIPDLVSAGGFGSPTQCFPFYTYNEDGTNRRENITDWALARFREVYEEKGPGSRDQGPGKKGAREEHSSPGTWPLEPGTYPLDKWAIFHYLYALLHHPTYRETYAANLRRELPRIPFVRDFWGFARAGARLAELHVNYEAQPEYPLQRLETPGEPLDWRVEKMTLSKDRTRIRYNDFLTLAGVPAAAFDYRLGNRSALEWVIDQYRVTTDKRSGITNDPNRPDDPEYIVRLIGQVVAVSVETAAIVKGLPALEIIGEMGRR